MNRLLKRFDIHTKTIEGVGQQTYLGALITIISVIVIVVLLIVEIRLLFRTDVESYVLPDYSAGIDAVRLSFDFTFDFIDCERLTFIHDVVRGDSLHLGADEMVRKVKARLPVHLHDQGCRIYGTKLTEKVGGSFHLKIEPKEEEIADEETKQKFGGFFSNKRHDILAHSIQRLMFVGVDLSDDSEYKLSGHYPLNGYRVNDHSEIGIKHYNLQVVPTIYKGLNGTVTRINQYSVTERNIDIAKASSGVVLGNQLVRNFTGIVVSYEFYPVWRNTFRSFVLSPDPVL